MDERVSVVIPAYDEAGAIAVTLRRVIEFLGDRAARAEIVVVDDGSGDGTAAAAEQAGVPGVRVVRLGQNAGKGAAARAGVAVTHGEVVVLTDADGEYLYNDAAPYIAAVERGADIVLASRVHPLSSWTCPECVGGYRDSRRRMGRVFNALVRAVVPSRLRDTQTGLKVIGFAVRVCGDGLR